MQENTEKPDDGQPVKTRLTCDSMLGKLSRDLRMLGVDTEYRRGIGGMRAYKQARARGRLFLTRSNRLKELPDILLVESNDPAAQLIQVRDSLGLDIEIPAPAPEPNPAARPEEPGEPAGEAVPAGVPAGRCLECNVALEKISREQARPSIPFFTYQIHHEFSRCPKCRRVFWPGSHVQDMARRTTGRTDRRAGGAPPAGQGQPSRPRRGRSRSGSNRQGGKQNGSGS